MSNRYDNPDLPYRCIKLADDSWEVQVSGASFFNTTDRSAANTVFNLVHTAYSLGWNGAFTELRRLIGA